MSQHDKMLRIPLEGSWKTAKESLGQHEKVL
jgi:hypothetical protein